MQDADLDVLQEMVTAGGSPLIDLLKSQFVGRVECNPWRPASTAAFAPASCDAPLCDHLLFLHEWFAKEQAAWLAQLSPGS